MTEIIETTAIPVKGSAAGLGAAMVIAVLAYPKQKDQPKRTKFIEALRGESAKRYLSRFRPGPHGDKNSIPENLRKMKNQQIRNIIYGPNGAIARLLKRMRAAQIAHQLFLIKGGAFLALGNAINYSLSTRGIRVEKISLPKGNVTHLVKESSKYRTVNRDEFEALNSEMRDIWMECLPVIHLALSLHIFISEKYSCKIDIWHLLNNPDWVEGVVQNGELIRMRFVENADTPLFRQDKAIVLVGEECC